MDSFEDMMELQNIGGKVMYNVYCSKIKEFLRANPGKTEREIAIGTGVRPLAITRAIREGVIEYVEGKGFVNKEIAQDPIESWKAKIDLVHSPKANVNPKPTSGSKLVDDIKKLKGMER